MKFKVNDRIEESFSFSQEQVNLFIQLTGDDNPIHYDEAFASNTVFRKPIIHGFLSSSVFSKILGIKMPGYGTIYLKQEMNFKKPMYVDTTYTCVIEILEIEKNRAKLSTQVLNEKKEVVIDGYAIVLNDIFLQ
jgi:3-hydroxybutyryl-CoA dehydratase